MSQESAHHKRRMTRGRWVAVAVLLAALAFGTIVFGLASLKGIDWVAQSDGNAVGGNFRLVSLGESTVTEADFRGSWLLVWFYDARSPKRQGQPILAALEKARTTLSAEGVTVRPVAVSLDPLVENDAARAYVLTVAPHVLPLTGAPRMIRAMTALYHVPCTLQNDGQGDGQHTYYQQAPHITIMDPKGHYADMVPASDDATSLIERLRQLSAH